jgi:hypothetical protein
MPGLPETSRSQIPGSNTFLPVTIVFTGCLISARLSQHGVNPRASFLDNRFSAVAATGFVCLLIGLIIVKLWYHRPPRSITTQSAMVRRTLDLSDYGTYRGAQAPSVPVLSLPAALVKLKLILPRFSDPGNDFVVVAPDRSRRNRIAGARRSL